MERRFSKLETGILWLARKNRDAAERPRLPNEYDVTTEEVLEGYFGITFEPGFIKSGDTYIEQSMPREKVAGDRYIRAEVAIWWAAFRLEDDGFVEVLLGALGSSVWLAGVNLTEKGIEQAKGIAEVVPTKRRWGRVVNPTCSAGSQGELDELQEVNGTSDFRPLAWVECSPSLGTHLDHRKSLGHYTGDFPPTMGHVRQVT
jgi:hypothetical protein